MPYYEHTSIDIDDQTIALHPIIDACDGSIAYRLLEHIGFPCIGKTILDVGAGTGQMCRLLRGFPGVVVEACDLDPQSEALFRQSPELKPIPFNRVDILSRSFSRPYHPALAGGDDYHFATHTTPAF